MDIWDTLRRMKVIGLMSGTSVDGIDAALVELTGAGYGVQSTLLAAHTADYPAELRDRISALCRGEPMAPADIAKTDDDIAIAFAAAAKHLGPADLIASHGQTVYHRPPAANRLGYSWQLGRGELIAALTPTPPLSNFREDDNAAGGQAAPLVSPVDVSLLSQPHLHRCVQNICGIGSLT